MLVNRCSTFKFILNIMWVVYYIPIKSSIFIFL
jgi:hypothetical protein